MPCVGVSLNCRTVIQHSFLRRRGSIPAKSFALVSSANLCAPCVGFSLSVRLDVKHNFALCLCVFPGLGLFSESVPLFYKVLCCRLF